MLKIRYSIYKAKQRKRSKIAKVKLLPVEELSFNIDTEDVTDPNWRYTAPYFGQRS